MHFDWQYINGEWYYLDPNTGAMQMGWIESPAGSGKWYYLRTPSDDGKDGSMHKGGWMQIGDKWFYMNPAKDGENGKQLQGWQQVDGKWYYMQESSDPSQGWMVTGRQQLVWNGVTNWYYFDGEGRMKTNLYVAVTARRITISSSIKPLALFRLLLRLILRLCLVIEIPS